MRILTRYVLFDLIKVFAITLSGLTLILFILLIGKEAVDKGIGLGPLLRMAPYMLPQAMQFAVPGTMLLAVTYVYGRMSSYNEIVAIKALGISPMLIIWPTFVLATLVSFGAVVLNDIAVSWGRLGVQKVFISSIEEVTYGQLRSKHAYNFGRANITVRAVDGTRLIQPTLIIQHSDDQPALTVSAAEAELRVLHDEGKIVLRLEDYDIDGPWTWEDPESFTYEASLDEITGNTAKNRSPSTYALAEIAPAIREQEDTLKRIEESLVAQSAFGLMTGDFDSLSDTAWKVHEKDRQNAEYRLHRLYTEPWRRWANGFSCLCFVLIGVPVAIWMRKSDFLESFFICFLPILLLYYPLLAVSVDQAKDGAFPPESVWAGNFLLSLAGIWLLRRVNRY
jgi:lipopolysaccharide export system permease protein